MKKMNLFGFIKIFLTLVVILCFISCGEYGGKKIVKNNYTQSLEVRVFINNSSSNYSKTVNIPVGGTEKFSVPNDGIYTVRHQKSIGSGYSDYYGYYYFNRNVSVSGDEEVTVIIDTIEIKY
jgi:hypothetical protein